MVVCSIGMVFFGCRVFINELFMVGSMQLGRVWFLVCRVCVFLWICVWWFSWLSRISWFMWICSGVCEGGVFWLLRQCCMCVRVDLVFFRWLFLLLLQVRFQIMSLVRQLFFRCCFWVLLNSCGCCWYSFQVCQVLLMLFRVSMCSLNSRLLLGCCWLVCLIVLSVFSQWVWL